MAENVFGANFKIDITGLKSNIKAANKAIRESEATFRDASSGMEDWSKSQDGLEKRLDFLNTKLKEQQKVVDQAKRQKAEMIAKMQEEGRSQEEISEAADAYNKIILQQSKAVESTQKEINKYTKSLEDMKSAENDAKGETAKLTKEISDQENKLSDLTNEYSDAVLKFGKTSEEAKSLKNKIEALNGELTANKNKLSDATSELKEVEKETKDVGDGFTVTKGAIAEFIGNGLNSLVSACGNAISGLKEVGVELGSARSQLQAATGATKREVEELSDSMEDLYAGNYGESLGDLANKMSMVKQQVKGLSSDEIENMTKRLIVLEDTFDMDFGETLRGITNMMENFGVSSDEAFDLIAKGGQKGLDKSHELGDNMAEYSQIFSQAGFSAQQTFTILQNGLDNGAYNLDKVNDFLKEFTISLTDGRIEENLGSFSKGTNKLFGEWKKGKKTSADVFYSVIKDIKNTKNEQDALTTAGTVWSSLGEDNAIKVIQSLGDVNDTYKEVSGTIDQIDEQKYDNIQSEIEALKRTFQMSLADTLEKDVLPEVKELTSEFADDKSIKTFAKGVSSIAKAVLPPLGSALKFVAEHFTTLVKVVGAAVVVMKTLKAAMAVSAAITAVKVAVSGLTIGVGAATYAQAAWNAVMAANPIGAVLTAVGLLTGGIVLLSSKMSDSSDDAKELATSENEVKTVSQQLAEQQTATAQKVKDTATAYNEAKKAADEMSASQLANVDYVTTHVLPALRECVDENGKLKKGQEERAEFLLGQYNEAMGTEVDNLKEIIDKNGKVKDSIYDTIEAKKVQILLESHEDDYKLAVQGVADAEASRATQAQNLVKAQSEAKKAEDELKKARENATYVMVQGQKTITTESDFAILKARENVEKKKKILTEEQNKYKETDGQLDTYYKNISDYESASTLSLSGKTDEALKILTRYGGGFKTAESVVGESAENQKKILGQQVVDTEVNAQLMAKKYKAGTEGVSKEMVETARKQADAAKSEFESVGGNITKGIAKGADNEETTKWTLSKAMTKLINTALKAAEKAADIHSPSRLFKKKVGLNIGLGVGVGIDASTNSVVSSVKNQLKAVQSAYDVGKINATVKGNLSTNTSGINAGSQASGGAVVVNQTNNYSQTHSRREIYQSKQDTMNAVKLMLRTV